MSGNHSDRENVPGGLPGTSGIGVLENVLHSNDSAETANCQADDDVLKRLAELDPHLDRAIQNTMLSEVTKGCRSERKMSEVISLGRGGYLDVINMRGRADLINAVGDLNDRVKAGLKKPPSTAAKIVYLIGLEVLATALLDIDAIVSPIECELTNEYLRQMEQQRRLSQLEKLYKLKGPEEFLIFCTDNNIPEFQEFLNEHTWRNERLKTATRRLGWLRDFLLSRNGSARIADVRKAAKSTGLAVNEREWRALQMFASRNDITGHGYGKWYWSETAQAKFESITL